MINARAAGEVALEWMGVAHCAARSRRGRTLVLAYHNVVPDGFEPAGDRSLHLARGEFARQMDILASRCDVIPLTEALADSPSRLRPRVAITFDDAYHGALTLGAAELRARGLPATMFVAPGLLGGQGFWWDALAGPDGLPDGIRQHALVELRGENEAVRAWARGMQLRERDPSVWERSGAEAELHAWVDEPSLSAGAHTWGHPNLARLSEAEVGQELTSSLRWLSAHLPRGVVPWLAYPYGEATPVVELGAKAAGYVAGLKVTGGWMPRPPMNEYALPRLNIPRGLTPRGFRLRLAGVVGSRVARVQHSAFSRTGANS